jgi:hypothetical protein
MLAVDNPVSAGTIGYLLQYLVSQPALAWLKVRYYAEVLVCSRTFDGRKYLSLSLPYMAISLWLAKFCIVEGGGRELAEVSWQVPRSRFASLILYFAWWRSLFRLADWCGRLQLRVPVGASRRLGYVRAKSCFGLVILNSVFGDCTLAYRAPVLMALLRYIVWSDVGNRRVGERLAASC